MLPSSVTKNSTGCTLFKYRVSVQTEPVMICSLWLPHILLIVLVCLAIHDILNVMYDVSAGNAVCIQLWFLSVQRRLKQSGH